MMPQTSGLSFEKLLDRYERIIEISQQLNSTLDHVALLRRIISAAGELTDSEACSILLIDPLTGELRFEHASNITANQADTISVPLEGSIAGWVATHGEPRVIQDVTREPRFFKSVDDILEFRTRNILAVPLKTRSKVIGVLEAVNKSDGQLYDSEDVKTLLTLAGQAAIAIENARLFQQSDFMAEMVHELRTPLAALKTSASLLLRDDLPDDRHDEIVETMQNETNRLIRMTSEFLDLARLESGRARLNIKEFGFDELISECSDVVELQAAARNVSIHYNGEPYTVAADRGKVKQVILNLFTNAIKYNRDHGHIDVRTYASRHHDEPFVELAISDTGYGISKEDQKMMFQKFYRAADTAGFTQGTGLGLAIAKHIIEGHGGNIWLESEPGRGSTFYVTLPRIV
jgi:signal transduction histidine kinase